MTTHYDRLETREHAAREEALFRELRALLKSARGKAPALKAQLGKLRVDDLSDREALRHVPVLRKSDLAEMQRNSPPFGGLAPAAPGALIASLFEQPERPGPFGAPVVRFFRHP